MPCPESGNKGKGANRAWRLVTAPHLGSAVPPRAAGGCTASSKGAGTGGALGTSSAAKEVEKRLLPVGDSCTGKILIVEPLEVVQLGVREVHDRRMGPGACRRKAEHRESSADRNRHRRSIESEVGRGKTRMTDEGLE